MRPVADIIADMEAEAPPAHFTSWEWYSERVTPAEVRFALVRDPDTGMLVDEMALSPQGGHEW